MKKIIVLTLFTLSISAGAAERKRELTPEIIQKTCSEVAAELIGNSMASDDGSKLAIYDIDPAIDEKLGIKLKTGEWMRAVAFNAWELDSPPSTTNKILVTRAEKYPATSCAVYDIGGYFWKADTEESLYSVEGRFTVKNRKIIFTGHGLNCPPPHRGGASMRAEYQLKGDKLIERKVVLNVSKCPK